MNARSTLPLALAVATAALLDARAPRLPAQPEIASTLSATAPLTLVQQTAGPTVTGRVVTDDNGEPIVNARIAAPSPTDIGTIVTLTDDEGRFTVGVPAGGTRIVASKSGYGRREIANVSGPAPLEIRLVRGAALSGRIVDEVGEPVQGARVTAYAVDAVPGARRAQPPQQPPQPPGRFGLPALPPPPPGPDGSPAVGAAFADTDDRGEYRIASLAPGTYVVAAMTFGAPQIIQMSPTQFAVESPPRRTYFPGTDSTDEAQRFALQPGDDRRGVDIVTPGARSLIPQFALFQPGPLTRPPAPRAGAATTAIVRGRVVGTDGQSLANALLRLDVKGNSRQALFSRADGQGRYEFRDLPAGTYVVIAAKTGYGPVVGGAGAASPAPLAVGTPLEVTLADGETREGANITLTVWGSLSGRVFDERGDPLQGATVQLMQVRYEAGRRQLVPAGGGARPTDDLGRYRLFSVPPGQYVVSAAVGDVQSADLPGYARSFYPGTTNPGQALFVSVGLSQELRDVDLALSRVRTARISGRMLDSNGQPTLGGSVRLMPSQRSMSVTNVSVGARIRPNGEFEFANVAPGQYIIQAYRGRSNGWIEGEFGVIPVSVDGADVADLVLQLSSGSTIHGRVTFSARDPSKRPSASAIELSPIPVDFDLSPSSVAIASIHDDWTFDVAGVNGPRRLQLVRAPAGWMLDDILVNGISALDRPLPFGRRDQSLQDVEVRLTDRISELTGTVTTDRREPAPGALTIVFATDRSRWYPLSRFLRAAPAGADGTFTISGLPFGSYYVAAIPKVPDEGADAWQDVRFLNTILPRATSVTIRDDQKQSIALQLPGR